MPALLTCVAILLLIGSRLVGVGGCNMPQHVRVTHVPILIYNVAFVNLEVP